MKRSIAMLLALTLCIGMLAGCAKDEAPDLDVPGSGQVQQPDGTKPDEPKPESPGKEEPKQPTGPYVYHWTRSSEETTLNPHDASTTNNSDVIDKFQASLYGYQLNEDSTASQLLPELADGEPTSQDGLVWNIKISPDAKWDNGEKITAHTFEYSFKMQLDPLLVYQTGNLVSTDFVTIVNAKEYWSQTNTNSVKWEDVGIKAVDDETLQITVTKTATPIDVMRQFYLAYTAPVYEPIYSKCISADGTTCTYGTTLEDQRFSGPFTLTVWNKTVEIQGKKNPNYIKADDIHIDELISRVVTDESTRLELFETGQSDSITLGTNGMAKYGEDPRVMSYSGQSIETLEVNQNHPNKPWLDDPVFRKAIYYAIDRNSIAKLTNNAARPFFLSDWAVCYADGTLYRDLPEAQALVPSNGGYNTQLAQTYMYQAMAKYSMTTFEIDILYTEGNDNRRLASEFIQSELGKIFGDKIKVSLSAATYNQINATMRTSVQGPVDTWDLAWSSWAVTGEKTKPWMKLERYTTWHSRRYTMYKNTQLDALIEQCKQDDVRMDEKKLTAVTVEAERAMFDNMTAIPVYSGNYFVMYSERVDLPLEKWDQNLSWGWLYSTQK